MLFKNKKLAFTTAEMILAISLVGVVVAITTPTLITDYQKQRFSVSAKKAYSELNNAVALAEQQHGPHEYWNYNESQAKFFETYLEDYLQLVPKADVQPVNVKKRYYQISGAPEKDLIYLISGSNGIQREAKLGYQIINVNDGDNSLFIVDTNGDKAPNTFGKDVFVFALNKHSYFLPLSWDISKPYADTAKSRDSYINGVSADSFQCNKQSKGLWCGALLMHDNWKFKDDYPW